MSLLENLLSAQGGALVQQIAQSVGLGEGDARSAVEQLTPALAKGLRKNTQGSGGMEALLGALTSGNHGKYVDQPETIGKPDSIADGNAILGHIFGSKDVSRNVAGRAAKETGIDADLLKKMLPMVAAAAMGAMSKKTSGGGGGMMSALSGGESGGAADLLGSLLGGDDDGLGLDDVLSLAKKFF